MLTHIITALQKWALVTKEKWHPPLTMTPQSPNTPCACRDLGYRCTTCAFNYSVRRATVILYAGRLV